MRHLRAISSHETLTNFKTAPLISSSVPFGKNNIALSRLSLEIIAKAADRSGSDFGRLRDRNERFAEKDQPLRLKQA